MPQLSLLCNFTDKKVVFFSKWKFRSSWNALGNTSISFFSNVIDLGLSLEAHVETWDVTWQYCSFGVLHVPGGVGNTFC